MKSDSVKLFTVGEANKELPRITDLVKRLREVKAMLEKQEVQIDALELVTETRETGNARNELSEKVSSYNDLVQEFYDHIDEINAVGCVLKDLEIGLIDFYSLYDDRIVFLCWQVGEEKVEHWHEIGSGFIHRQPVRSNK